MAAKETSSIKSQKMKPHGITSALESAALEWLLICLLFIDAVFSYIITKFACRHGLQTPCLLCSRLDHILGNKKKKHYWNLICGSHKLEISSLVFCHAHNNLVDVRGMCESCLFSFATINKSNAETYRLLVGKLGEDTGYALDAVPHVEDQTSSTRNCSCCSKPWIPKGCNQKLMQSILLSSKVSDHDAPLSSPLGHDCDKRRKSAQSFSLGVAHQKNGGLDPLSHVGYTELNINSDTESEAQFSGVDDGNVSDLIIETNTKVDVGVECVQTEPRIIILSDDLASEKLIDSVSASEPSTLVSNVHLDVIDSNGATSIAYELPIGHGLEELDWKQADSKAERSAFPELISIDEVPNSTIAKETPNVLLKESTPTYLGDVPPSSDGGETLREASKEKLICTDEFPPLSDAREAPVKDSKQGGLSIVDDVPLSSDSTEAPVEISKVSKLISLVDFLPASDGTQTPVQELEESCLARTEAAWQTCLDHDEICKAGTRQAAATEIASETNLVSGDNVVQAANMLDLSDAYKLATGSRARQLSGKLLEQWVGKDSTRVSEDLKLLISQLSASREQANDVSPRPPMTPKVSLNSDELKIYDASSSMGMHILQKRVSLERNESGLSLDGSNVSEIEGESVVDRLRRQVEHDRKLLNVLYKELEEERSASAIAANQAMAMITKLQEEKATLHMEALQCLRMMEEQAEYDMEALQKTNDLLVEREKEIQDLEAELEFYRIKYHEESQLEDTVEPAASHLKAMDVGVD